MKRKILLLMVTGFVALIGFALFNQATVVKADSDPEQFSECLTCHQQTLEYHDKLGSGNEACQVCHDPADMSKLKLVTGTQLTLDESSQLCGQCHQKRYSAWQEGTHGFAGTVAAAKCVTCHDPHKPQIVLLGITKPHPGPIPDAPEVPVDLLIIGAISIAFLAGLGIMAARRGAE
ncbi:cytochrome c3 family protein [Chloroflexota bacterium]